MYYFAYGSNLHPPQMARRCPGAMAAGRAILPGWRLILSTKGSANIVPDSGSQVHGALWRFMPHHLALMDDWEGVASGTYRRHWTRVHLPDGGARTAITYLGSRRRPGIGRSHYIQSAMVPGARAFGLPDDYIKEIERWLPARPIGAHRAYPGRRTRRTT